LIINVGAYSSLALAQEIIENPEKPLSEQAGRVLQLVEELRITDEGGEFFFRSPLEVKVDEDGFVYVREKDKLFRFDPDGKFIKNILRSGEGPGEVQELASFEFDGDEVILFCSMRNKIIRTDKDGNLIQDSRFDEERFIRLLSFYENKYFVLDYEWKNLERTSGIKDLGHSLFIVDEEGKISSTPYSFPTLQAMKVKTRGSRGRGSVSISPITRIQTARAYPNYLYIAHTQDYMIKLLDFDTSQIIRFFRREYEKVKRESQESIEYLMTEYQNDAQKLLIYKDKLWVLTSTYKEGKGILVDVFNQGGEYIDNFFLPLFKIKRENLGLWPMTVDGENLFILEINEDETLAFVKYKIGN
jgi:hypothetical protein